MTRLLIGSLLLAIALTASAADTAPSPPSPPSLYKVELIVFENLDPAALHAEQWPEDPGTPPLDNAMELNALTAAAAAAVKPAPAPDAVSAGATPADASGEPPPGTAPAPLPAAASAVAAPVDPAAATPTLPAVAPAPTPPEAAPVMPSWRWLDQTELALNGAEQKLINSGKYHPLLHIGWIQPLDSSEQGTPIHIYDDLKPQQDAKEDGVTPQNNAPQALAAPLADAPAPPQTAPAPETVAPAPSTPDATPPPAEETPEQMPPPPHVLDGTFTLRRGRFLHADVDLGYRKTYVPTETLPDGSAAQPVTLYVRMTQSRRLRNDELNYLDHPLFGVLFVVSPYLPAAADAATTTK
jgi:hypothetical protein